ncbi:MAG TPA: NAD(P)H-dependent oxidoreductase [Saprospiraceae bacterium]|nr:NAD(P)H-dependent oxidoreductase [Saprospiraceae bacterium]
MNILAFSTSASSVSINKKLVKEVLKHFEGASVDFPDMSEYDLTIFTTDKEKRDGIPEKVFEFASRIDQADLIILSLAEHNGAYTAIFKNLLDWTSRIPGRSVFNNRKIFLLATSTGPRGGSTVLGIASSRFPFNGGEVVETFSLPSFNENFDDEKGILIDDKRLELLEKTERIRRMF